MNHRMCNWYVQIHWSKLEISYAHYFFKTISEQLNLDRIGLNKVCSTPVVDRSTYSHLLSRMTLESKLF